MAGELHSGVGGADNSGEADDLEHDENLQEERKRKH
jgi:hypothetical protein